jgi:anti-sigma factor (TIGR02949 family)
MTPIRPMDCDDVVKQAWDWLDNELDVSTWKDIEAHLASCSGCTEHIEFAQRFLAQVKATPADADDIERLRARVRAALRP